ncbi:MAG: phosphoglycerate kinase [Bdellovibrio sp.]
MARGLKGISSIRDFQLHDKVVFLRLDLNVPLDAGRITDETRIQASLPTIRYALEQKAKLVLASHLGRPKSAEDRQYSLEPVARRLSELLNVEVILVEEPGSEAVKALLAGMKRNQILLLENLRFEKGETENSEAFARQLASYTDVYVNDAFGASHRAHASIEALPALLKHKGIGFLIQKEIQMLDSLLDQPARPYWAILGGAKVSDKIAVIEKLMDVVDGFIIGGAMAYTFLRARGKEVGSSLVEVDKLSYAREMMARLEARGKSLLLPVDHVVATSLQGKDFKTSSSETIEAGWMGLDIGPKTRAVYREAISRAQTIFWNGPMGVFEKPDFARGTFELAEALANNSGLKIVGGGDSAAAAEASGFADKMSHISTGGGASLEYLQGDSLPGLEILRNKRGTPAVEGVL